ncbi:MAG TPA: hypothetical protein VFD78_01235 [Chitinophagaceae bacterium]|nr:hypothetical protein [Chitinophagaceae bacterium]
MTKFFLLITLFLVIVSCNKDANAQQAQIIERINHLSLSNNADSLLLALSEIEKIEEKNSITYDLYLKKIDLLLLLKKIDLAYSEMIENKGNYEEYDLHLLQGQIEKYHYKNDKYLETWKQGILLADKVLKKYGDSNSLMNKLILVSLVTSKEEALSELKKYSTEHEIDSTDLSFVFHIIENFEEESNLLYLK